MGNAIFPLASAAWQLHHQRGLSPGHPIELMAQLFADLPGTVECGELAVREEARGLLLPTAIFARWSR